MNNVLSMKWKLILLYQLKLTVISHQSIAGVTYMDNFDFEDRYQNIYECDPFHWHPLHLPEQCAEMYSDLISSRLAKRGPVRVVKERQIPKPVVYSLNPNILYSPIQASFPTYVYNPPVIEVTETHEYKKPVSPYDKILNLMRKDVEVDPSLPVIGMVPNIGPAVIYHQPISKKSTDMIKKLTRSYKRAQRLSYVKQYGKIIVSGSPEDETQDTTTHKDDNANIQSMKKKSKKQPKIITLDGCETFNSSSSYSKILCFILSASCVYSSIAGISYMDPLYQKPIEIPRGENPCNPLYWYPRQIPDYCYKKDEEPVPLKLIPAPLPQPLPLPIPVPVPLYQMAIAQPMPQFIPLAFPEYPIPQMAVPQLPYGMPISNQMSIPAPYLHHPIAPSPPQAGLVPGIPGIVSQDGGINILPFSDAYSDMLEKHKQKMIRKRLQKVLDEYEDYPRRRKHHKHIRN